MSNARPPSTIRIHPTVVAGAALASRSIRVPARESTDNKVEEAETTRTARARSLTRLLFLRPAWLPVTTARLAGRSLARSLMHLARLYARENLPSNRL